MQIYNTANQIKHDIMATSRPHWASKSWLHTLDFSIVVVIDCHDIHYSICQDAPKNGCQCYGVHTSHINCCPCISIKVFVILFMLFLSLINKSFTFCRDLSDTMVHLVVMDLQAPRYGILLYTFTFSFSYTTGNMRPNWNSSYIASLILLQRNLTYLNKSVAFVFILL